MDVNERRAKLPTFQEAYRNANKAYKFIIHDAEEALDQILAGYETSEILIPKYLSWCQKELNFLKSEKESGMYINCQTNGLQEIEHSFKTLIEAFQKQERKHKIIGNLDYLDDVNDSNRSDDDNDMLIDDYTHMHIE